MGNLGPALGNKKTDDRAGQFFCLLVQPAHVKPIQHQNKELLLRQRLYGGAPLTRVNLGYKN